MPYMECLGFADVGHVGHDTARSVPVRRPGRSSEGPLVSEFRGSAMTPCVRRCELEVLPFSGSETH